ncbi:MAG TPA: ubiquinol-cytochrome c reductase iron-sulfur subunit [Gemmatimonadales bacterium]|nr:ubiquinol-cytochrome c reductase iron-sulfur subunit [Gemmatimonadales bacterium]
MESGVTPTRRRFVDWLLGTSLGGLIAAVVYPASRYLVPPRSGEAATASVTLAMNPDQIPPNTGQIFKFGSRPGMLLRTPGGELRAFSATCTHLGCIVQYRADMSQIWCACHNGHFDLNGTNVEGPPPRPLERFEVNVRGDQIVISKGA